jgi:pimeloyl-ACP methyl ester carboxylesterase
VTLATEMEDPDLVRRRCELDQVVLFGWSYHGGVVANYAGRHPDVVLRMVLSGPIAPRRIPYSEQAAATLQSRLDMTANRGFHEVAARGSRGSIQGVARHHTARLLRR